MGPRRSTSCTCWPGSSTRAALLWDWNPRVSCAGTLGGPLAASPRARTVLQLVMVLLLSAGVGVAADTPPPPDRQWLIVTDGPEQEVEREALVAALRLLPRLPVRVVVVIDATPAKPEVRPRLLGSTRSSSSTAPSSTSSGRAPCSRRTPAVGDRRPCAGGRPLARAGARRRRRRTGRAPTGTLWTTFVRY